MDAKRCFLLVTFVLAAASGLLAAYYKQFTEGQLEWVMTSGVNEMEARNVQLMKVQLGKDLNRYRKWQGWSEVVGVISLCLNLVFLNLQLTAIGKTREGAVARDDILRRARRSTQN